MGKRPDNWKIADIKVMRVITNFLGRLGISHCTRLIEQVEPHYDDGHYVGDFKVTKRIYGLGLKEAKDYIEAKYEYTLPAQVAKLYRRVGLGDPHYRERSVVELVKLLTVLNIPMPKVNLLKIRDFSTRYAPRN